MKGRRKKLPARQKPASNLAKRANLRRMPASLPKPIVSRLNALAARVLHVAWVRGGLLVAVALCALVLIQGTLDWLFDLSAGVRGLFLFADLLILGFVFYKFWVRPWQMRLTPDEAALSAERHWPELRTGLISAVQLARRSDGSPLLVGAMLDTTAARVEKFDLRAAVQWNRLKRLFLVTCALVAVTVALIAWLAPASLILLQRILLVNVPLPTQTIVTAMSGDFLIPNGQTIELAARATGVIPKSGRVEVTYEGKRPEMVTISPKASSPDVFSLQLANIQQPLTYRFFLNDGHGEEWKVELLHPPVMQEIAFDVTPPPYAGLPPTPLSPGSLTLLAGSKLKLSGKSSQPLKGARLVLTGKERSIDMRPEGSDRTGFSAAIDVPKEGFDGLWIELKNDKNNLSQNNTVYAVQVLPDKPPEIVVAENQPEKMNLVAEQKPRLRFEVRDDFKVQEVFLCIQPVSSLGEGEEPDPKKGKEIPIPVPVPAAGLAFDFEWKDPEKTGNWTEGTTLTYWIKAVDNNNVTGPGISYTSPREWSVVSLQTKREELAEQLRKHAESIKDLSGAQESLRNEMGEMLKQEDKK